jgi:hypothetical protein
MAHSLLLTLLHPEFFDLDLVVLLQLDSAFTKW